MCTITGVLSLLDLHINIQMYWKNPLHFDKVFYSLQPKTKLNYSSEIILPIHKFSFKELAKNSFKTNWQGDNSIKCKQICFVFPSFFCVSVCLSVCPCWRDIFSSHDIPWRDVHYTFIQLFQPSIIKRHPTEEGEE